MKREFNILNYLNSRALFMGIGLSKLLIQAHEYIWISLILGTIIGAILIHFVKFKMKKSLLNVVICSILFVIGLNILINMISTMYLTEMPKLLVGIPIILLVMYILNKREVIIYRVANILFVLNIFLYVVAMLSLVSDFHLENFTYSNTPIQNVIFSALEFALFSTLPTLITRDENTANISLVKTYIISAITMGTWFLLTYGILGANLVDIYRYPEYIILKKISIMNFLENIENIVSFVWLFDIIIFLLCNGNAIKKNVDTPRLINILLPILLLITAFINRFYILILYIYKYSSIILLILAILLFVANKKRHQTSWWRFIKPNTIAKIWEI